MAWNGSGTFTRTNGVNIGDTAWEQDRDAGTKITVARHDAHDTDIANGINNALAKDGQNAMTGDFDAGSNKLTAVADATAHTDAPNMGQVQDGAGVYVATDSGSADAYAIAPSPAITAYAAGQCFSFPAANASTGASTLNVSALGTKAIEYQGSALGGAEIAAGAIIVVEYDGTAFQMVSPSALLSATNGDVLAANNGSEFTEATFKANLNLEIGTDVQAYDATEYSAEARTITAYTGTALNSSLTHEGGVVTMSNASANVFTIEPNATIAHTDGAQIDVVMLGAGVTSVTGGTGVTLNDVSAGTGVLTRYQATTLVRISSDVWVAPGLGTVS